MARKRYKAEEIIGKRFDGLTAPSDVEGAAGRTFGQGDLRYALGGAGACGQVAAALQSGQAAAYSAEVAFGYEGCTALCGIGPRRRRRGKAEVARKDHAGVGGWSGRVAQLLGLREAEPWHNSQSGVSEGERSST